MKGRFVRQATRFVAIIMFVCLANSGYLYAGTLNQEAASYREKGYSAQERGDLDAAINWYQKAAKLDPNYAAPHNDLGILFETKGWLDRAESEYYKALAINPDYKQAHTNLALLYERKGELEKAAFHWMRRFKLGRAGDPWTEEARQRLEKIGLLGKEEKYEERPHNREIEKPLSRAQKKARREIAKKIVKRERTALSPRPMPEIKKKKVRANKSRSRLRRKRKTRKNSEWTRLGPAPERKISRPARKRAIDRELEESLRLAEKRLREEKAQKLAPEVTGEEVKRPEAGVISVSKAPSIEKDYLRARNYYHKGEYSRALDIIRRAKKEHPDDSSLLELEQVVKNKMKEERIEDHYKEGIMRYQKNDFTGARKEFEAILNILPE